MMFSWWSLEWLLLSTLHISTNIRSLPTYALPLFSLSLGHGICVLRPEFSIRCCRLNRMAWFDVKKYVCARLRLRP